MLTANDANGHRAGMLQSWNLPRSWSSASALADRFAAFRRQSPNAATAVSVGLRTGSGKFSINKRTVDVYFPNFAWKHDAIEPLKFTSLSDQVDVVVTAHGGGVGGQAGAVRMGLARAISRFNAELRPALRKNGFLTRDSRMKERKKYGQKGARKRFQFTKR